MVLQILADNATSLLRGLVLFGMIALSGAVWIRVRGRWAPRTIENWSGEGIHEDLKPVEAALLIRCSPAIILAAQVFPRVLSGRMKILAKRPLRLAWSGRAGPQGKLEQAIDRVFVRGEGGKDAVVALLEELYARVNDRMLHHDGRKTAVHYRRRVASVRERVLRDGIRDPSDATWLLLDDPDAVWRLAGGGESGEAVRRVLAAGQRMAQGILSNPEILERARKRPGFFRYRADLRRIRQAGKPLWASADPEPVTGALEGLLRDVADRLEGKIQPGQGWQVIWGVAKPVMEFRIVGRHEGRPVVFEIYPDHYRLEYFVDSPGGSVGEDGEPPTPFTALEVRENRLVARAPLQRESVRTEEILEAIDVLARHAERIRA
jgi:hypothetical protein